MLAVRSLKDLCLDPLLATAERFLDLQWSDGRFEVTPEYETEVWNHSHQQYILAAAVLYTTDHPANPWRGNERLWEAILRHGRHLAGRVDSQGAMLWNIREEHFVFVCQRLLCAWLLAYELVHDRLPEEDERVWRETLLRGCEWLWAHHIVPRRNTQKFTAHPDGVNTGTNHFSLYLALLYRVGRRFDRPEWVEGCTDLMHKLIAAQAPAGYWPEHEGPALGYDYLTYHGVDEYTAWSGDETGLTALRRGLELHRYWTYPNGAPIECLDGRMRHTGGPFLWGLCGFARWPEGRGYARLLLSRLDPNALAGEGAAKLAETYLMLSEQERAVPRPSPGHASDSSTPASRSDAPRLFDSSQEKAPPQLQECYRSVLEGASVVRKEGPWVIALSRAVRLEVGGQRLHTRPPVPVERVARGSRPGAGREQLEAAARAGHLPPREDHLPLSVRLLPAKGACEATEVQYATFRAAVQVRMVDSHTLEVALSADAAVTFTLVPAVFFGKTAAVRSAEGRRSGPSGKRPSLSRRERPAPSSSTME